MNPAIKQKRLSAITFTGSDYQSETVKVRNFFTRLLHGFLLYNLMPDELYELYTDASLVNRYVETNSRSLAEHFWDEADDSTSDCVNYCLNRAERMFLKRKLKMYPLLNDFYNVFIPSNSFLYGLNIQLCNRINNEINIRHCLINLTGSLVSSVFHNAWYKVQPVNTTTNCGDVYVLLQQKKSQSVKGELLDIEITFGWLARLLPAFYNLEPFLSSDVIMYEQTVNQRLGSTKALRYKNDTLLIDNEPYGYVCTFNKVVEERFPEIRVDEDINRICCVIEKEYFCTVRKRAILKKDAIYGAPYSLIKIIDKKNDADRVSENAVAVRKCENLWSEIERKHEQLVNRLKKSVVLAYDKKMQTFFVNGIPVTCGIQAKIFSSIVKRYMKNKCEFFEWRDLAAIDELICDPQSTGLSTRLGRLISMIDKINCGCRIEKANRGKYRLTFTSTFTYSEK